MRLTESWRLHWAAPSCTYCLGLWHVPTSIISTLMWAERRSDTTTADGDFDQYLQLRIHTLTFYYENAAEELQQSQARNHISKTTNTITDQRNRIMFAFAIVIGWYLTTVMTVSFWTNDNVMGCGQRHSRKQSHVSLLKHSPPHQISVWYHQTS